MLVQVVVVVEAAALGGFPCRCNVPQCTPASSSIEGEGEGEGEEEFMGGCSVAWDLLLPSLRRWSGTDGRTPLQIHKRKHQPDSRT